MRKVFKKLSIVLILSIVFSMFLNLRFDFSSKNLVQLGDSAYAAEGRYIAEYCGSGFWRYDCWDALQWQATAQLEGGGGTWGYTKLKTDVTPGYAYVFNTFAQANLKGASVNGLTGKYIIQVCYDNENEISGKKNPMYQYRYFDTSLFTPGQELTICGSFEVPYDGHTIYCFADSVAFYKYNNYTPKVNGLTASYDVANDKIVWNMNATDPNGDPLTYVYSVDNKISETSNGSASSGQLSTVGWPEGTYTVRVGARDKYEYVNYSIKVDVYRNYKPTLTVKTPAANSGISNTSNKSMSVSGTIKDTDIGDTGLVYYRLDGSDGQEGKQLCNAITADGTEKQYSGSIDISSLAEGSHTLYIWGKDKYPRTTEEIAMPFRVDNSKPSIGNFNAVASENGITVTGSANDSNSGLDSNPYRITIGTNSSGWISPNIFNDNSTSGVTYSVNSLLPDTLYKVKFEAKDKAGMIIESIKDVYTKAVVPVLSSKAVSTSSIELGINDTNPTSTLYQICCGKLYLSSDGKLTEKPSWITLPDKKITVTGLANCTEYLFQTKVKNTENIETEYSNITRCTTIGGAPQNINITTSGTSINISWDAVPETVGYDLEVDGQIKNVGMKTTYLHTALKLQTQHTYRVRARNIEGPGRWSTLQTAMTTAVKPSKPANLTYTATNTTATINWDAATDAESYEIVEVVNGQDGRVVDNGSPTTCEKRGLAPASTHTYKIRAVNSIGTGEWSDPITITTFLLDTPSNINTIESDTSITLTWNPVKDAASYVVEMNGTEVTTGSSIYVAINLTPETKYTFRVKAVGVNGTSSFSGFITTATTPIKPAIPANVNATVSDTLITVTWDKVENAEGYDIELDDIVMEDDDDNIYIHDGLESDTIHTYRVRARNSAIEGDWSEMQYIKTLPGKPVIPKEIEIKSSATGATLIWKGKDSDISYDIKIYDGTKKADGTPIDPVLIENIAKNTYTHRRTALGQEYTYWIRTRNAEGVSDWSGKIVNNAIKAKCTRNKTVDLGLTAKDVTDFSAYTMVVTYNASAVDVIDLSTLTGVFETAPGRIEDTDIEITDFAPGKIIFKCDKVVNPGEAWTGVINSIKFKARATGGTTITYTVLCKPETAE